MGKQKQKKAARRDEAPPQVTAPPPRPVEKPAFWFGFEVSWSKLLAARVVIFTLLALDALLAIRHAPRYGAGGFNVAQLPFLDRLGPTRISYLVGELLNATLFTFAALGVATRFVVPAAAAIYAWLYLGSQLDSYQHHYLVALILLLASFVPWQRPVDAKPATPVRSWALRLILVQLGILYFWAAISKLDPAWLDGRTLGGQIKVGADTLIDVRSLIDSTIGIRAMSNLVVLVELALAFIVWMPRAWFVAAPLGILFHLGIVLSGLEIGLFAWLMIGFYTLLLPDRAWIFLGEELARFGKARRIPPLAAPFCALAALGLAAVTRTDHALAVACVVVAVTFAAAMWRGGMEAVGRAGVACVVAVGLWLVVDRTSAVTTDYYKFWGGSARRLGDLDGAERAYRRMVDVAPDDVLGHLQLGRLLLGRGDELDGMAELHEAQRVAPKDRRAFDEETRYLQAHGRASQPVK